ncbi:MAG: DUF7948 domain-containing protein, partial [Planctomycetota bacterium]
MSRALALVLALPAAAVTATVCLSAQSESIERQGCARPHAFVLNQGQWDSRALFRSRKGSTTSWFVRDGWIFTLEQAAEQEVRPEDAAREDAAPESWQTPGGPVGPVTIKGVTVRMRFVGAAAQRPLVGEDKLPGIYNFFRGDDPACWETKVPSYARMRYPSLYVGVDMVIREGQGLFEYDLHLAPEADLTNIVIGCEGIEGLEIDDDGALVMHTAVGTVSQTPPVAWHVLPSGAKKLVTCRYRLVGRDRYGFEVPRRLVNLPLVIDPDLTWSTFLGGTNPRINTDDQIFSIAKLPGGNGGSLPVTVAGRTDDKSFPTSTGAFQRTFAGMSDVIVTQLDPSKTGSAQLVWSTFLGGSNDDMAFDVQLDKVGFVYVTGITLSPGSTTGTPFPTTAGAFRTNNAGGTEAFVTKLGQTGANLIYSTYLGGSANDWGCAIAVDNTTGQATIAGYSASSNFPTRLTDFQPGNAGFRDPFVTRLNTAGSARTYSTFVGGSGQAGFLGAAWQNNPINLRV